ncbi:type II toxin-antitoxin system HicB family antitoxin [Facklamia hominis]|uniref:HicB-like antitoxin of toxin-antitoxin system domain-containing protein n=1 Tax=Facklamia hominis CCUG 36813 TaxID=883111 RepID=K1LWL5_9LACT|nr:type II toxin-antitoxin system HicB family antitoxin [Facklamia hominis]EKB54478.1 hypothetical protein HMPREF9706_00668 [Facklamia hominis CCUG 36813]
MKYSYYALMNEEGGIYTISFPDIPGAISEADSIDQAILNAQEVLEIFMLMYENEGNEFPKGSSARELSQRLESDNDFIQLITVDTRIVRMREENKSVNKMVTLPKWLVELGKERQVNFSQLLQSALRSELHV